MVVDARPSMEGKTLLASMVALGLSCTYVQLDALSYIMADVSKVFIGAAAMMNNGTVLGRAGTAMVKVTAFALCAPLPPWRRRCLFMASTASAAKAPLFPRGPQVAMVAHAYHVPVMVCCETYKFCERARLAVGEAVISMTPPPPTFSRCISSDGARESVGRSTALVNGQAQLDSICYNDKTLASAGAKSSPLR